MPGRCSSCLANASKRRISRILRLVGRHPTVCTRAKGQAACGRRSGRFPERTRDRDPEPRCNKSNREIASELYVAIGSPAEFRAMPQPDPGTYRMIDLGPVATVDVCPTVESDKRDRDPRQRRAGTGRSAGSRRGHAGPVGPRCPSRAPRGGSLVCVARTPLGDLRACRDDGRRPRGCARRATGFIRLMGTSDVPWNHGPPGDPGSDPRLRRHLRERTRLRSFRWMADKSRRSRPRVVGLLCSGT